jgi:hypothetical protein
MKRSKKRLQFLVVLEEILRQAPDFAKASSGAQDERVGKVKRPQKIGASFNYKQNDV